MLSDRVAAHPGDRCDDIAAYGLVLAAVRRLRSATSPRCVSRACWSQRSSAGGTSREAEVEAGGRSARR